MVEAVINVDAIVNASLEDAERLARFVFEGIQLSLSSSLCIHCLGTGTAFKYS